VPPDYLRHTGRDQALRSLVDVPKHSDTAGLSDGAKFRWGRDLTALQTHQLVAASDAGATAQDARLRLAPHSNIRSRERPALVDVVNDALNISRVTNSSQ